MNCREFRDALDDLVSSARGSIPFDSGRRQILMTMESHVAACARCRRLHADVVWLDRVFDDSCSPLPGPGFTDRLIARWKREKSCNDSSSRWAIWIGWAAAAMFAAVMLRLPRSGPQRMVDGRAVSVSVSETIGDTRRAYLALMEDMKGVLGLPEISTGLAAQPASLDPLTPPLGRAIRRSTDALVDATKGVGTGFRPITQAAVGAFGFLWKDLDDSEKPSI